MSNRSSKRIDLNPFKDRTPVQRRRASDYLLITLLSFAFSVGGTRLFLELTGYPQLGGGQLHFAHVLWGGLFLFVASLLPLVYVNEWALSISALLAGFGIGLFIDEVGKFITQTNDYFYPSAAPIVYALFLLTVLFFSQVRQTRKRSTRAEMYRVLERFNEVLDHDLSRFEYADLLTQLEIVIDGREDPQLNQLAQNLKDYLVSNKNKVVPHKPTIFDRLRIWYLKIEKKWLGKKQLKRILVVGLLAWGAWAMVSPLGFILISRDAQQFQIFIDQLIANNLLRNLSGFTWFEVRVLLEGSAGLFSLTACILLLFGKDKIAIWIGLAMILVTLTIVNLLVFYFDQFSTIIVAGFHFILLLLLIRYQRRFLPVAALETKKEV